MSGTGERLGNEGLAFFGRMDAAVSHELKNILAIVGETASLLEDIIEANAEGRMELSPAKLKTLSRRIVDAVGRGQQAIRRMNAFAHSIDHPVEQVQLGSLIELMVGLSRHFLTGYDLAFTKGPETGPGVLTSPFRLENLFHLALRHALASAGPERKLKLFVRESVGGGGEIVIEGLAAPAGEFPTPVAAELAAFLGCSVACDNGAGRLTISVPAALPGGPGL
jgi:C4-dicarboxylate-specific signal transduction histidine kinase